MTLLATCRRIRIMYIAPDRRCVIHCEIASERARQFKLPNAEPPLSSLAAIARSPPSKSPHADGIPLSLPPTPAWPSAQHPPAPGSLCSPGICRGCDTPEDILLVT